MENGGVGKRGAPAHPGGLPGPTGGRSPKGSPRKTQAATTGDPDPDVPAGSAAAVARTHSRVRGRPVRRHRGPGEQPELEPQPPVRAGRLRPARLRVQAGRLILAAPGRGDRTAGPAGVPVLAVPADPPAAPGCPPPTRPARRPVRRVGGRRARVRGTGRVPVRVPGGRSAAG